MAEKEMVTIPAGSLLTVSSGTYSDYSITGVFRAKADIDAAALLDEWLRLHPEQAKEYRFREHEFMGWVARKDLLEAIPCFEWHITDYSNASDMCVDTLESDIVA